MAHRFRRSLTRTMIALLFLQSGVMALPLPASASSPLLIGEIAWAGSSRSTADEWLEIWNVSKEPISLEGYRLFGAGGGEIGLPFPATSTVPAGGVFLVSNYANTDGRTVLTVPPDWVTTAVSLPNDKLLITLMDPVGTVVDQAGDGTKPSAGSSGDRKTSMQRLLPPQDGSQPDAWKNADQQQQIAIEVPDLGTPGTCDGCFDYQATLTEETFPPLEEVSTVEDPVVQPTTTETLLPPAQTGSTESTVGVEDLPPLSTTTTEEGSGFVTEEPTATTTTTPEAPSAQHPTIVIDVSGPFVADQPLVFDASSSTDPNGDIVTFIWDLGDQTVETAPFTEHTYASSGTYLVHLDVSDGTFHSIATTTVTLEEPETPPTPATTTAATETLSPPATVPAHVALNEIYPAPVEGPEWIEVRLIDGEPSALVGWQIYDATGRVMTIDATFLSSLTWLDGLAVIPMPRTVLNNGSDTVRIFNADGELMDEIAYPSIAKGWSYARTDGTDAWKKTDEPTPGTQNPYEEPDPEEAPKPTITQTVKPSPLPTQSKATVVPKTPPIVNITSKTVGTSASKVPSAAKPPTAKAAKNTAQKKPAAKNGKITPLPSNVTFFDLPMLTTDMRVRLSGTVGSVTGLLPKNAFVLLSADGRGLYVAGNGKQPSPAYGTFIEVTGSLTVNDDGVRLRMLAKDSWVGKMSNERPQPRIVDLLLPAQEDGWSLVEMTATVLEVSGTKVKLATQDAEVNASIKAVTHYRAARLKKGDEVKLLGILDTRSEPPTLLPRFPDDITIVGHAKLAEAGAAKSTGWPTWSPFGAAGLAVAASEGAKRLQKIREQKRLERMIEDAAKDIQAVH